jgi:protein-L-isoaspartate(D-aspartate) O-methyltransferase
MTSLRTRERLITRLREQGIRDERVLEAMRQVPRHLFVDEALASRAYDDVSLPIGHGQTLSQPFTVARMTEILMADAPRKVLEIGTGSGYQTAVLSKLVKGEIFSIERMAPLFHKTKERLNDMGLHNVRLRLTDGMRGWPEDAPFDAILAAAAPAEVPAPLLSQLRDGGTLVLPVGTAKGQRLVVIRRRGDEFVREELDAVTFVPMLSGTRR